MIKSIRSDQKSFKAIHFTSGLNVVLAERKDNSSNKDSRNGLGKSTLIDIIHFCLASSGSNLRAPELKGWTFIMELILGGNEYTVSRNTEELNKLWLEGDFSKWPIQPEIDSDNGKAFMKPRDWCLVLGFFMFGLSVGIGKQKYAPTFRSLISYFGRSGLQAFGDPFKHFNMQSEWDKQVHNAFLLALNWEYASEFQKLKDEEKKIATFKSAADEGLLEGFVGTLGTLEAERITLDSDIEDFDQQIAAFNVHPQYYELQESANNDTQRIHELINRKVVSLAMLKQYRASISEESDVSHSAITKIYEEAGLFFPVATEKRIQDVLDFHSQVIKNRKSYLESEIQRLSDEVNEIEAIIETVSADRAKVLATLQAHGALDEYSRLQERLTSLREKREAIKIQIENLKKFEEGIENIAVEKKALLHKARQDKDERLEYIEAATRLYNQNSKALYNEPGTLSIDLATTGYKFNVDIKRAQSQGVGYMKVFCYDLMLAQLRSIFSLPRPNFLIHDSTIFDGVDERQIANALELAVKEAESKKFQYICTLNSDMIPTNDWSEEFSEKFKSAIRIRLSDASEDGGLLGKRF